MNAWFAWENLIFVLALLVGGVFVAGAALGLGHTHGGIDLDGDGIPDIEADHDLEASSLLAALGIGRAPLSVFVTTALLGFGTVGLCLSGWLGPLLRIPIAALSGLVAATLVSRLLARYVPSIESYAGDKREVLGLVGIAETRIERDFGVARVCDSTGSLMQLKCRAYDRPIQRGVEVIVVDYDAKTDFYSVLENPKERGTP